MSLPSTPPRYPGWSALVAPITMDERFLKKYMSGTALEVATRWRTYAVQRGVGITADGYWGPVTDKAVKDWQRARGLVVDGIVGGATQLRILIKASNEVDEQITSLPDLLLKGMIEGEGANVLAATNWYTPPGGALGVDCGPIQWRQYGPPFTYNGLLAAFAPQGSIRHAADALAARKTELRQVRATTVLPAFPAKDLLWYAVLAHNAPFLSFQVARYGKLSTPNAEAVWTRKADGTHYTHAEWAFYYPNKILKYVDLSKI